MQVLNVESPNINGKLQFSQPVGVGGYVGGSVEADQTARNPVREPALTALNVTMSVLPLEMMVHGLDVCPQCLEFKLSSSISTQSSEQVLPDPICM